MTPQVDIVSLGTLSCNPFWGDVGTVRPAHATTTVIRDGDDCILVDPSLPAEILESRLAEQTGLTPDRITAVFLTNFRPVHRRGLALFPDVPWYLSEQERSLLEPQLERVVDSADEGADRECPEVEAELELLRRTSTAPEKLSRHVDLFPSPGVTPGACALLVAGLRTIIVAGDAVLTGDHLDHGRIYERAVDPERAKSALAEIIEIADIIVPGHGNFAFR